MLAVVIVFLYTILSYLAWVTTFTFRIEPKYRKVAIKAGLGYTNKLQSTITASFHDYKNQMFVKNEPPRRPGEVRQRGPFYHTNEGQSRANNE